MNYRTLLLIFSTLAVSACANVVPGDAASVNGFIQELPEDVLAITAPSQDLNTVMIDPTDGCFVYRHTGPVETTFLPLRAVNGRPICSRLPEQIQAG